MLGSGRGGPVGHRRVDPTAGADLLVFDVLASTEDPGSVPEAMVSLTDAAGTTATVL